MTWTFDLALSGPLHQVRYLVQDTLELDPLVSDEEILFALSEANNNVTNAALDVARRIALKFARMADMSTPDISVKFSERAKLYWQVVQDLEDRGGKPLVAPYAGGISVMDTQAQEADTDRVRPSFTRGMHDFFGAPEDD